MKKTKKYILWGFLPIILIGIIGNIISLTRGGKFFALGELAVTVLFLSLYLFVDNLFYKKNLKYIIPSSFFYMGMAFAYFSMFLGSYLNFYERFAIWDDVLHFSSGVLLGLLCIAFVAAFISYHFGDINSKKTIIFTIIVGCLVSISVAVFWEFYEYSYDILTDGNMQRGIMITSIETFDIESYLRPSGRLVDTAIVDTMGDFFHATIGALIASIFTYVNYHTFNYKINKFNKNKTDYNNKTNQNKSGKVVE